MLLQEFLKIQILQWPSWRFLNIFRQILYKCVAPNSDVLHQI